MVGMPKQSHRLAALLAEWRELIDRLLDLEEEIREECGVKPPEGQVD